jgi:tetratricopeptide (TPR) repeat protein
MKRLKLLLPLFFLAVHAIGQDIDTGKKHYYYKRYNSAEQFFHDYLKQQPQSGEGWLGLAKCYAQLQKAERLKDSLSKAPADIQDDPYFLLAKGIQSIINKQAGASRAYFEKAIDLTKGKKAEIFSIVGEAQLLSKEGNLDYGIEVVQKGLKKEKNSSPLYVVLGNLYLAKHDGTEAYRAYQAAIDKDGGNSEAYYQLGLIFLSQKNTDLFIENFKKAVSSDNRYAPAWYELYNYYRYTDPATAMTYFKEYTNHSDKSIEQEYGYTDLLYLNKDYANAIKHADALIKSEGEKLQPRIHKLIAYSLAGLKDSANAIAHMQDYFHSEIDSNIIVKDYELMADLFSSQSGKEDSVMLYYSKAADKTDDSLTRRNYFKELARLSNLKQDYAAEAMWRGKFYENNFQAKNIDLFNWGLASYRAEDYHLADSVFGLYTEKYPDQGFGYYWRARSNAAIDTTLAEGLAIPYYQKLVAMIANDTLNPTSKKWMLEAYSYLAAYETNTEKDYKEAIGYFDRILEIDPQNDNAKKYISILEQNLKHESSSN